MSWRNLLLTILVVLTVFQAIAILASDHGEVWPILVNAAPTAALWLGFAYRYFPRIRVLLVRLMAFYGKRTTLRVSARYEGSEPVTRSEVVDVMQKRNSRIKVLPAGVNTVVEMDGWTARFALSTQSDAEGAFKDSDEVAASELLITIPEMRNAVRSALSLLQEEIFPLLEGLERELAMTLKAADVTVRFTKQPNPYLAAYLQNLDLERITTLKCVLNGQRAGTVAEIGKDKVVLRAQSLSDLNNLAQQHLAMQWSF